MKKTTITITSLALLAILSCGIVIHISCRKENDCSCVQLSKDEETFLCYNQHGQKAFYKNDITNALDTLSVNYYWPTGTTCSYPCDGGSTSINVTLIFSNLFGCGIYITHDQPPEISFDTFMDDSIKGSYNFFLNGATQTISVNSTNYNDVYTTQIDSTTIISNGDKKRVPWKLYYSKSQGFVRFYMINGQTWSKL